jgi:hypothetical protein
MVLDLIQVPLGLFGGNETLHLRGAFHGFELPVDTVENFLTIDKLAALSRLPAFLDPLSDLFSPLQEPERLTDQFARRVVASRLDLALHEIFEFRREMDVHTLRVPPLVKAVNSVRRGVRRGLGGDSHADRIAPRR